MELDAVLEILKQLYPDINGIRIDEEERELNLSSNTGGWYALPLPPVLEDYGTCSKCGDKFNRPTTTKQWLDRYSTLIVLPCEQFCCKCLSELDTALDTLINAFVSSEEN